MKEMKIIYQDENLLVIDKPAGWIVFPEDESKNESSIIEETVKDFPELKKAGESPRYGAIHRLDKDTSGVLLIAKNNDSLKFFQEQFQEKKVIKEYWTLCVGRVLDKKGIIDTFMSRAPGDRRKQKAHPPYDLSIKGATRKAVTTYEVLKNFENYTLIKVLPQTGRKHQIRCHMAYLHHPIAGDPLYGFKNQPQPEGLERQFLHARGLKIKMPDGQEREFISELPDDLAKILDKLKKHE